MAATFLEMAERHRAADMLIQGFFEKQDGKACSVGCFNADLGNAPDDFEALANFTGYPEWAHRLQEAIFEGLPPDEAKDWHVQFAERCERVRDWKTQYHQTMIGVLNIALPHDTSIVVQPVIDLHKRAMIGDTPTAAEWAAARDATRAAARDAARAAAWAAEATRAAAWAAEATRAAAWPDIRDAFLNTQSDTP